MGDNIKYNLKNYYTGEILYEGHFLSIKHCVELAINDGVCLDEVIKIGHDYIPKMDLASAGMKYLSFLYGGKVA